MFAFIFILTSAVALTVKETIYTVWDNSMIQSNVVLIGTFPVSEKPYCAVLCSWHDLCIGANFWKDTLMCELFQMEYWRTTDVFINSKSKSEALTANGKPRPPNTHIHIAVE